jgi:hypothetical protein
MGENKDKFRMYGLVPRNIGTIDKGIQFSHALQEYNNNMELMKGSIVDDFSTWRLEDKTVILLDGGTSITMEEHIEKLLTAGIHLGVFREPDLNNMVTGIVFLVPEQVYKKEVFPDFAVGDDFMDWFTSVGGETNQYLRTFLSQFRLA